MNMNITRDLFGSLTDAGYPDATVMFLVFLLFVVLAYKAVTMVKNAIVIAVISLSFPFVLNWFFGFALDITLDALLFYATAGVVIYVLYEAFKVLYNTSRLFLLIVNGIVYPFVLLFKFLYWLLGGGRKGKATERRQDSSDKEKKALKKRSHDKKS